MQLPSPLTLLGKIWWVLNFDGPMTANQISEAIGEPRAPVRKAITEARVRNLRDIRFRRVGHFRENGTTHSFVYDLSNAPDGLDELGEVRVINQKTLTDLAQERSDKKRIQLLASECRPFKDPMIWMTAGRAP